MKIGKKFVPHPNLKKVYYTCLGLAAIIPLVVTSAPLWVVPIFATGVLPALPFLLIPLAIVLVIIGFITYWIGKYYRSISFTLKENEVMVERGVWWKMKHVVPYARVMSVDIVQGPISRRFGVGRYIQLVIQGGKEELLARGQGVPKQASGACRIS